jgi:hypothetical protein
MLHKIATMCVELLSFLRHSYVAVAPPSVWTGLCHATCRFNAAPMSFKAALYCSFLIATCDLCQMFPLA